MSDEFSVEVRKVTEECIGFKVITQNMDLEIGAGQHIADLYGLAKVFCSQCAVGVTIINYTGAVKNGNIILRGSCAVCGHEVVRLLDGSGT
jgi:hypothetical protein